MTELKSKGYNVEKSVVGRFGFLLVCKNLNLLAKNPGLLLAASSQDASEEIVASIEKEMKK